MAHRAGTVAVIWLVSIAMALPKVTYIQFDSGCTWSVGRGHWLGFLVPAFLVYYVAPLLCIALHCGLIITHLYRCRGTLAADHRNKKATALLIGSTLVFAISWLPYYVLEFVNVLSPSLNSVSSPESPVSSSTAPSPASNTEVSLLWEVASLSAILLICLAPCWNPPLYFLLSKPALRQLRRLLPIMHQHWRAATFLQHIVPKHAPTQPHSQPGSQHVPQHILAAIHPQWEQAHSDRHGKVQHIPASQQSTPTRRHKVHTRHTHNDRYFLPEHPHPSHAGWDCELLSNTTERNRSIRPWTSALMAQHHILQCSSMPAALFPSLKISRSH